ncbi:MAG: SDR family oxidoreductase [Planctomycetes bacterium]|nr:SDR family oxidoreductase [Planctomycetota bacterium]
MKQPPVAVAVVGVSALFPGSSDAAGFWRDIVAGRDLITEVPPTHWLIDDYYDPNPAAPDKTYCKRGAFLSPVDFDPMEFGVPPSIVPATDTAQLLALVVAQRVLDDASQGKFASMNRDKISVILGVTSALELLGSMVSRLQKPVWMKALRAGGLPETQAQAICERMAKEYVPWQESSFPGLLGNVVAGRIANRFDLRGTNAVTDAACASTMSALSMGLNELTTGQSDLVLTGGVDAMNDIFMYMCFSKTPALSPTGDCRPFSDAADGTLLGEGMAMLALKRLPDAERDGDRIYAVIRGLGSASDGRSKSVYAPLPEGQARALRRAYESAGFGPETVELVEAHGTGTKAGDLAEFEGLRLAFEESGRADRQWCALGSVKSQIGHTKAAAGAAGLFKAVMALHHRTIPPTIKVERPNGKLEVDKSPFYLNTQARPWIRDAAHPRRAGVSSFGFGGSNFHVVLEEYTGPGRRAACLRTSPTELVVLGAATGKELGERCRAAAADAKTAVAAGGSSLAAVARAAQSDFRSTDPCRLAVVATCLDDLAAKLDQAASAIAAKPESPFSTPTGTHYAVGARQGGIAFLFPGQGSQYVGMSGDLAIASDTARAAWDAAAGVRLDGLPLQDVVFPRPAFSAEEREAQARRLTATEWAQPAIGVASLALLEVLRGVGVRPDCVGGHSFGEVTALCAAGVLDAKGLVTVARRRGELMRDAAASAPGAMLAVARPIEEVRALLDSMRKAGGAGADAGAGVVIANHNHPTQVVLSGPTASIEAVERRLATTGGGTAKRLPVSTAFHSELVAPSSVPFAQFLAGVEFRKPSFDVYSNAEAAPYPADADGMRRRLAEQIARPVRFVEQVEAMYARGVRTFVEVGPGSVLTELVGRILGNRSHTAVALDRKGRHGETSLQEGLGRLAVSGVALDFAPLWAAFDGTSLKAPGAQTGSNGKKKPAMALPLSGSNYGKPYPPPGGSAALPPPNPERPAVQAAPVTEAVKAAPATASSANPALVANVPTDNGSNDEQRQGSRGAEDGSTDVRPVRREQPAPAVQPTVPGVNHGLPTEAHVAWVQAYQEAQRQTAEAHAAYQRAMADSHIAFLKTVETSFVGLSAMLAGTALPVHAVSAPLPPLPALQALPAVAAAPAPTTEAPAPRAAMPAPALAPASTPAPVPAPAPARATVPVRPAAPPPAVSAPVPAPAAIAPPPGVDLLAKLLAVVSDKTGYPTDMLTPIMELEADLGIDSIKRVEILSAMREAVPGLPPVDAAKMGALRTLGQIVDQLKSSPGSGAPAPAATPAPARVAAPAPAPAPAATPPPPAAPPAVSAAAPAATPTPSLSNLELQPLLLAVVSEKTGYPADMLGLQMELESDLGIDSIKRVEILSAMRERAPGLPPVDAARMGALRTLGQIVDYLRSPGASKPAPAAHVEPGVEKKTTKNSRIRRYVVRESAAPAVGLALPGLGTGRIVLTDDGGGLAPALARRLAAAGIRAEVVREVPADADAVLFLGGLRTVAGVDEAVEVNREAFRAARSVAARFTTDGGLFVTVQDTGGDFGLAGRDPLRAWLGGVAGLARTAAVEWPRAAVKAIDLERGGRAPEALAEALFQELLTGGPAREVGLHADGTRTTLSAVPAAVSGVRPIFTSSSVLLVSGGARGVTAAALLAICKRSRPRVVLLGRTPLDEEPAACRGAADEAALKRALLELARQEARAVTPAELGGRVARILAAREIRVTLDALRAAGSEVRYLPVDVGAAARLRTELDTVRREWGPITGLIHGAGVLADKLIAEKTDAQFDRVFDTKVAGLRALLDATASDPLVVLALFSSVAARTGNLGQCDYAAANEVLNKVAAAERRRRGDRCVVKSFGWGPWEGGMVTPALKGHFEKLDVPLIPLELGARMFVEELESSPDDVELVIGGPIGGGALGAASDPSTSLEVWVDSRTHPYLSGHVIGGRPVVPVVLVLEWFARAARGCRPDLALSAIRDVRVLRGIRLDRWAEGGHRYRVNCRTISNGDGAVLGVELRGDENALHYSASVELTGRAPVAPQPLAPPMLAPWAEPSVYDGRTLFHGPSFQVIRSLDGISEEGIAGELAGTREQGWPGGAWRTDAAALDGALQLALLWTRHVLGGASLPMSVGAYVSYAEGLPDGPLRGVVHRRQVSDSRAVCDVAVTGEDGRVLAELRGVETILVPGDAAARPVAARV